MRKSSEKEKQCASYKSRNRGSASDSATERGTRRTGSPTSMPRHQDTARSGASQRLERKCETQVRETEVKIGGGDLGVLRLVQSMSSRIHQIHTATYISNTKWYPALTRHFLRLPAPLAQPYCSSTSLRSAGQPCNLWYPLHIPRHP